MGTPPPSRPPRVSRSPPRSSTASPCASSSKHCPPTRCPAAGGVSATIVVTMTLEQLTASLSEHGVCALDTGGVLTAGEARRLACTAGIIPMVLGGRSEPLDLGRKRRLHSPAQRLAMAHRDGGCTAVGCDRPPSMCQAHHDTPWSLGGGTTVEGGRLPVRAPPPTRPRPPLRAPDRALRADQLPPTDLDRRPTDDRRGTVPRIRVTRWLGTAALPGGTSANDQVSTTGLRPCSTDVTRSWSTDVTRPCSTDVTRPCSTDVTRPSRGPAQPT